MIPSVAIGHYSLLGELLGSCGQYHAKEKGINPLHRIEDFIVVESRIEIGSLTLGSSDSTEIRAFRCNKRQVSFSDLLADLNPPE